MSNPIRRLSAHLDFSCVLVRRLTAEQLVKEGPLTTGRFFVQEKMKSYHLVRHWVVEGNRPEVQEAVQRSAIHWVRRISSGISSSSINQALRKGPGSNSNSELGWPKTTRET